ncbi:MAG: hypothetical protein HOI23_19210 [Deltaproteobacteria bacterium]|nr:hypothetical protein [Deltaproteobacteria bacterium]MBT6434803.1 hypothetical protein [Deltaproteobacteria bacterium]MBT6492262.1 hypothetical protein [Deltaproteobacteria bacterium]
MKYLAWIALAFLPFSAFASDATNLEQSDPSTRDAWSFHFDWAQVVGSGTFASNSFTRSSSDYVGQSFGIGLSYDALELQGKSLRLSLGTSVDIEFTAPTHGGLRRVTLNDTYLRAAIPALYTETFTGFEIGVFGSLTLPTSITSYRVKRQWFVVSAGISASAQWGILEAMLSTHASKYAGATVSTQYGLLPAGCGLPSSASDEEFTPDCLDETTALEQGFANVSVSVSSSASLSVEIFDHLLLSYALGVKSFFKYAQPQDVFTSDNATGGLRRMDFFSPSWSLRYPLSKKMELPLELSIFVDASAFHRVRSADNKRVLAPIVFNAFGALAANGYGSLSTGVSGSW